MKTKFKLFFSVVALSVTTTISAQTTAMDFSGIDCNGNNVDLFQDLDAGTAVVLFFYMPNCGSCPPSAQKIQTMANNINTNNPGAVKAYSFPYQNSTTCSYSASWVTTNNLPLYTPMDSGAVQVAYYGGFGMPTVVLLGGDNRDVLFVTQDFNTSDTTTMRNLILGLTANTEEISKNQINFEIFPNPSFDKFNLNVTIDNKSEFYYQILDLSGKLISSSEKEIVAQGKLPKEIDNNSLQSGSYFLRVYLNNISSVQKFNVAH